MQVAVPSRTRVDAYDQLRRRLDEIVGRINGAHGSIDAVPIHYLYRSVTRAELLALYRAADVMLVTPLRDGMNLVAKEFVASRVDEDGVLILSEFAGAASEMAEALQVNPYDLDRVAMTIKEALTMTDDERAARMRAMRRRVRDYDVHRWANAFIDRLRTPVNGALHSTHALSSAEDLAVVASRLCEAERLLLLLDYDGTLMPFASTPELAAPDLQVKKLLRNLAMLPRTSVHVLSGRTRQTLDHWLGDLPIGLHAEHGFWSRNHPKGRWEPITGHPLEWKLEISPLLEQFAEATPGSLVEEKTAGFAWHYRMADPIFGEMHARELHHRLEQVSLELPVEVISGDKVIEIRSQGINKGTIAMRLMSSLNESTTILAIGDDRTDEDLFAALGSNGYSLHVGPKPSKAAYRVSDSAAARAFLATILEKKEGFQSSTRTADPDGSFEATLSDNVHRGSEGGALLIPISIGIAERRRTVNTRLIESTAANRSIPAKASESKEASSLDTGPDEVLNRIAAGP